MKIIMAIAIASALSNVTDAQTVATDSISQERILIGPVERSAFQDSSWYRENYSVYKPQVKLIHQIDSLEAGDSVLIVLGSWCSDSHMWVPMFLSIMDSTALARKIGFITVPRSKGWRDQLTAGLNIEKVPTFIFYHDGKEIGRIVEEPKGDIGDNIVEILESKSTEEMH
ncbi:MAG TPA: thioredoxin family protein [Candidatus Acidoferrales bacterium]|nr:thioredoxin family protein [Candidatus Acidoferrales bacterium]